MWHFVTKCRCPGTGVARPACVPDLYLRHVEDRRPLAHPAAGLAQPRRKIWRSALSCDGERGRPPPHLPGQQILPRGVAELVRRGIPDRGMQEARPGRAGDLHGAGAVFLLGQTQPGARTAPAPELAHRGNLPRSPAALCRHRHGAAAIAAPRHRRDGTLRRATRPAGRADRFARQQLEPRRAGTVPLLRGRGRSRRRDPDPSMGHDGQGNHAQILAAVAGRDAGRAIARSLLPDLRRRAGTPAELAHRVRARRRLVPVHHRPHRTWLPDASGSGRHRQRARAARIFQAPVFRFVRARSRGAALSSRHCRRRPRDAGHGLPVSVGRTAARQRHRRAQVATAPARPRVPRRGPGMAGFAQTTIRNRLGGFMNRNTGSLLALFGACALAIAPAAFAADYSLASGAVKFSAPDAWPMLMEKLDGPRQFVALQVKNPGDTNALARITVTTEQVDGVQGFQKFLNDGTARARKLPGYMATTSLGDSSSLRYTATENREKNAYTEVYAYRSNLAIQVRCIRPAAAAAAWSSTFDAGCQSIVAAVEK